MVSNDISSGVRSVESEGGKCLLITAPISHSFSDEPLFNTASDVIGIYSQIRLATSKISIAEQNIIKLCVVVRHELS
jgi:hypothetical protein